MIATSGAWVRFGNEPVKHHVSRLTAKQTTCGRRVRSMSEGSTEPGSDPCRRCWSRLNTDKPPQDLRHEEEIRMATKTRGKKSYTLAEKKPEDSKAAAQAELPKPDEQATDKLKSIRSARRLVKKKEIALGLAHEAHKEAKEELSAAVTDLCRIIDESGQGEMFVGTEVSHLDRATGELENEDSAHDDMKVTLSAGGKSATTTLGGMKRATEAFAGKP